MSETPQVGERKDLVTNLAESQEKPENWDKADFQAPVPTCSLLPPPTPPPTDPTVKPASGVSLGSRNESTQPSILAKKVNKKQ